LAHIIDPLCGEFAVRRSDLFGMDLAPGAAVDLGILAHCARKGAVHQVCLGSKRHKHRRMLDLGISGVEVAGFLMGASSPTATPVTIQQFPKGLPRDTQVDMMHTNRVTVCSSGDVPPQPEATYLQHLPRCYENLPPQAQQIVRAVLDVLASVPSRGLVWGGSRTAEDASHYPGDVDFYILVTERTALSDLLARELSELPHLTLLHRAGYLPWMGELLTLFFFPTCNFAVDIGVLSQDDVPTAYPGRAPHVMWGTDRDLAGLLQPRSYARPDAARSTDVLVNLVKIRKNLLRGHLWNALEYVTRIRRQLMGVMIQDEAVRLRTFRPDREAEEFLQREDLAFLTSTVPTYAAQDIARCASDLTRTLLARVTLPNEEGYVVPLLARMQEWLEHFAEGGMT